MARHETLVLLPETWTQLTNSDVQSIVIQNQKFRTLLIMATVGAVAPTTTNGAWRYEQTRGEILVIADLFPGISGANRIYAFTNEAGLVTVSHA